MAEQLGINGSFRNSTTVNGNVRSVFATTELMNNLRKTFLTDTTFPRDKYGQIRRCHLHGYINGPVQFFGVTDNAKPELHTLYFWLYHKSLSLLHDKSTKTFFCTRNFGRKNT